jgi:hypothetical protein
MFKFYVHIHLILTKLLTILVVWVPNKKSKAHMLGGKNWKYKCPSIRDGPYGGVEHTHAYFLWQLHFHWGSVGDVTKGSEHTVDGMS